MNEVNEVERSIFTKEELARRVRVSPVVESDLKRIITDRMEQCGLYFRVFSRAKTASSMARKFEQKAYGGEHRLQDLIGVRINLYFDDDVEICRYIMEQTFEVLDWSTSERSDDEFKPTKLNGVCRLPEYLKREISTDTWDMCIDDTFEIQIKTMFFEGWHEIEHDMRYKGEELWMNYQAFSRYLNSILATLELCDKSMVTLFEDLGHTLYKAGRWSDMIKSHFRVKMSDASIYPEVEELLNEDAENGENLAKEIYKTPRMVLIEQLLHRSRRVPINVNTIIALLNDGVFRDSRLNAIFRKHDVYNDGREESLAESRHYELRPLTRQTAFQMCTQVDGSHLKNGEPVLASEIFDACVEQIYGWIAKKYGQLFKDMPQQATTFHADILAYHVAVNLDTEKKRMNMHVRHMDPEVGGRIWYSEASLEIRERVCSDEESPCTSGDTEDERYQHGNPLGMPPCESPAAGHDCMEGNAEHLAGAAEECAFSRKDVWLCVSNGYAQAKQDDRPEYEGAGTFFSYPGYYKLIVDGIGIYNSLPCSNRRRIIREDGLDELERALQDPERKFPIVVIISKEDEDGMMDEDWLGQFRVSDFTRTVWRYAHVLTCYEEVGRLLLERLMQNPLWQSRFADGEEAGTAEAVSARTRVATENRCAIGDTAEETAGTAEAVPARTRVATENRCAIGDTLFPRLYIFWPDGGVDDYGPEDVENCSFGRHLEARSDARTYDIVRGGQALYHQVVTDLRDWNVSADMWDGFQLEIMTEIPG